MIYSTAGKRSDFQVEGAAVKETAVTSEEEHMYSDTLMSLVHSPKKSECDFCTS